MIRVYGRGEIDPHAPGVYNANAIAAGQIEIAARSGDTMKGAPHVDS